MFFASQLLFPGTATFLLIGGAIVVTAVVASTISVMQLKKHRKKAVEKKRQQKQNVEQEELAKQEEQIEFKTEELNQNKVSKKDLQPESKYDYAYIITAKSEYEKDKLELSWKTNDKSSFAESLKQDARVGLNSYFNDTINGIQFEAKYKSADGTEKFVNKSYDFENGNSETLTDDFENDIKSVFADLVTKKQAEQVEEVKTKDYANLYELNLQ